MSEKIVWEKLPGVPDLPENQVQIWQISLVQPAEYLPGYSRHLSVDELERADRFIRSFMSYFVPFFVVIFFYCQNIRS